MAVVYILYSNTIDSYYIGSCKNLSKRLAGHKSNKYTKGFTRRSDDWRIYFSIESLEYEQARKIEKHIKGMKSRKYIEDLTLHSEIVEKLIERYK